MKTNKDIRRNYHQYLQSWQWRDFTAEQIEKANHQCWTCSGAESLQVHHLVYRDVLPWEYEDHEVRVLCEECHKAIHNVADLIWVFLLRFEPHELELILKRLKNGQAENTASLCRSLRGADVDLLEDASA